MTTIITRAGKGSPLTNNELDQNFINLNNDKAETSNTVYKNSDTGAAALPSGPTEERPVAAAGLIRFNTTDDDFEGLTGTGWESLSRTPFSDIPPSAPGVANPGMLEVTSRGDHVHPQDEGKANKYAETAAGTSFEPSGTIIATTVQTALQELDNDIQAIGGGGGGGTPSDTLPIMDGSAAAGIATEYSRGDHIHPSDTSKSDISHTHPSDATKADVNHTHTAVTTSADGFMIAADKSKLDGIAAGANNYTHPASHPPAIITQDASNRFVTDTEKATWNAKGNGTVTGVTGTSPVVSSGGTAPAISMPAATASAAGHMTSAQASKLDGIAAGANNYTHPASHPPSIITQDSSNRFVTDAEKSTWNAKAATNADNVFSVKQTFNAAIVEQYNAVAAANIDCSLGAVFSKTITALTTFTVSNVAAVNDVTSFVLELTNGGAYAITWWSGIKWAGGTVPTFTTAGLDILGFYTRDGGATWRSVMMCKDSK